MKYFFLSLIIFLFFSCKKSEPLNVFVLQGNWHVHIFNNNDVVGKLNIANTSYYFEVANFANGGFQMQDSGIISTGISEIHFSGNLKNNWTIDFLNSNSLEIHNSTFSIKATN